MRGKIDINEVANITKSISLYYDLASSFYGLDPSQRETLQPYWDRACSHSKDGKYMDYQSISIWEDIDLHVVKQMWASTACGWGGIGGAAMSESYTTVIYNRTLGGVFIFYSGQLAYVAQDNEKMKPYIESGFKGLPGLDSCKSKLDIIYKKKR
jgi:hypothetical protein